MRHPAAQLPSTGSGAARAAHLDARPGMRFAAQDPLRAAAERHAPQRDAQLFPCGIPAAHQGQIHAREWSPFPQMADNREFRHGQLPHHDPRSAPAKWTAGDMLAATRPIVPHWAKRAKTGQRIRLTEHGRGSLPRRMVHRRAITSTTTFRWLHRLTDILQEDRLKPVSLPKSPECVARDHLQMRRRSDAGTVFHTSR